MTEPGKVRVPAAHRNQPSLSQTIKLDEPVREWWVAPLRWSALAVFIALPIFCLLVQRLAGRVVWTMVIAGLPLFIVLVGYHRWRRICPLALVAQLPAFARYGGTLRMPRALEQNYHYLAFGVFLFSLWMRLIATNGNGNALALFLVSIALLALITGLVFTGKSWCNYLCPVSFVEKIYTEPHGLRTTTNSQCEKCTACKKSCPDINQENGYWKEAGAAAKQFVYFAFPGLVFGFYFYYFLQSGSWEYYFSGSWTNEPEVFHTAFARVVDAKTAGFYFLYGVPRALAAFITLVLCAGLSFLIFRLLQIVLTSVTHRDESFTSERVRHIMFSVAAFSAFVTFYTFAGAPTLRKLPWVFPHIFLVIVVGTATMFLLRRLRRTETEFAEETLAHNIIKRWKWQDQPAPKNLREAFLVHQIRSRDEAHGAASVIETYKEAVFEALADGFITREEVQMLDALRSQLQIKPADHERVMAQLAEEERALLTDPGRQLSAEKRLQLETYAHAVATYFDKILVAGSNPDESFITNLRSEYGVTRSEHEAVLRRLFGAEAGLAERLSAEVTGIVRIGRVLEMLASSPSQTMGLLGELLLRARRRAIERIERGLNFAEGQRETGELVRASLAAGDTQQRLLAIDRLRAALPEPLALKIEEIYKQEEDRADVKLDALLAEWVDYSDPYIRALTLLALNELGALSAAQLQAHVGDENALVQDTASGLLARRATQSHAATGPVNLLTAEKMCALRAAPIFRALAPESLHELARNSREQLFAEGDVLCEQGSEGNEVFILLAGRVLVLKREGDADVQIATEAAGGFIGEMAVLDPAPRSATVRADTQGAHVLCLNGVAFRAALERDSGMATSVISTLARRLRG